MIIGNWEINPKENKVKNKDTKEEFILFEPIKIEDEEK